ncbi:ankyrin repeat protein [Biomphalaria glabrata]|uniref:Ankyrin repeat protein RF_0381 n=1 Tax=Biomphalaria glabrata TaxID=6526 RepID=A0A9W2ZFR1_BIOGL|nr:putative ankyrin repeat protein RF_0381 [Biomphalaria glabrata]XP_055873792.1 putative ankyrin repeat protein RF_0381 [Biomphalaria glabrata]KAI8752146.1 putative ankyrin repeat protein [Biomphalaria glabrata]
MAESAIKKRKSRRSKHCEQRELKRKEKLEELQNVLNELFPESMTRFEKNGPGDEQLMNAVTMEKYKEMEDILSSQTMACSQEALDRSLLIAADSGQKLTLVLLLKNKANPNCRDINGNTPLILCAQNGFLEMVRILINNGASVNEQNNVGDTALILSIRKSGSSEMARLLCNSVNVNIQNKDGYTALMKAIESVDPDTIKILIINGANTSDTREGKSITEMAEQKGVLKILKAFSECKTPQQPSILSAVESRDISVLETFLTFDKNCIKMKSSKGKSALEILLDIVLSENKGLSSADKEICKLLIVHGVEVNVKKIKGIMNKSVSPLAKAVQIGDLDLVRWLCLKKANINESNFYETMTPLMMAAKEGFVEITCFLLSKQANVEVKGREGTALDIAVKYKKMECAKILLEEKVKRGLEDACKAAIEYKEVCLMEHLHDKFTLDIKDAKLLEWTIESDSKDILTFLISKGADVNSKIVKQSYYSSSRQPSFVYPLHLSVAKENLDLIKLLIESGADIDIVDSNGDTPLFYACSKKNVEILKYLLTTGAEINTTNDFGKTPIFVTVELNQVLHFKMLLKWGADVSVCDKEGNSLICQAIKCRCADIVSLLLDLGVDTHDITKDGDSALTLLFKTLKTHYYFEKEKFDKILRHMLQESVDVNRQDVKRNTALMIACKLDTHWPEAVNLLLQKGANVNMVNDRNESALSVTLTKRNFDLTKVLLENKATFHLPSHCQEAVHLFISENRPELLPLALGQGVYPFLVIPNYSSEHIFSCSYRYSRNDLTPLSMALIDQRFSVVTFLIQTRFLTKHDVTDILSKPFFQNTLLQREKQELLDNLLSLKTLSFVRVSDLLDATPDREQKVNQLPIPNKIKDQLLFRNLNVKMETS